MNTRAVEKRKDAGADPAAQRVRMWLRIGDLIIVGIALLVLVELSRVAQGKQDALSASRLSNARSFDVEPVIRAWHPWEQAPRRGGLPYRDDQWRKSPPVAILGPIGIEVVEQMHSNGQNAQWSSMHSANHEHA